MYITQNLGLVRYRPNKQNILYLWSSYEHPITQQYTERTIVCPCSATICRVTWTPSSVSLNHVVDVAVSDGHYRAVIFRSDVQRDLN